MFQKIKWLAKRETVIYISLSLVFKAKFTFLLRVFDSIFFGLLFFISLQLFWATSHSFVGLPFFFHLHLFLGKAMFYVLGPYTGWGH